MLGLNARPDIGILWMWCGCFYFLLSIFEGRGFFPIYPNRSGHFDKVVEP